MRLTFTLGIAALLGVALAGCGSTRPSNYYQLELPSAAPPSTATQPVPVGLLIGRLSAPHLYRDDRIVYRAGARQLGAYAYQRWTEPPTEMIEAMLLHLLRSSGRYKTVQMLHSNAVGDYIVRGRLRNLEEVSGGALAARVAFEIELYEIKTGSTVWSQYYAQDEPVQGKDVAAVVEALNRNVQRGLEQAAAGIENYFAAHPAR